MVENNLQLPQCTLRNNLAGVQCLINHPCPGRPKRTAIKRIMKRLKHICKYLIHRPSGGFFTS
jgi:hypothetical protein